MKLDIYLNYPGNCREAFRFYEQHLGGEITMLMSHGEGPNAANLPKGQRTNVQPATRTAKRCQHLNYSPIRPDNSSNMKRRCKI